MVVVSSNTREWATNGSWASRLCTLPLAGTLRAAQRPGKGRAAARISGQPIHGSSHSSHPEHCPVFHAHFCAQVSSSVLLLYLVVVAQIGLQFAGSSVLADGASLGKRGCPVQHPMVSAQSARTRMALSGTRKSQKEGKRPRKLAGWLPNAAGRTSFFFGCYQGAGSFAWKLPP